MTLSDAYITISDNGEGIKSNTLHNPLSMGLLNMKERANLLGAVLDINSSSKTTHLVRASVARILGLIQLINDSNQVPEEKQKVLDYLLLSANELDEVIKDISKRGCKINCESS